jgi:acyl-coenzyme A synthetase/AMP-(fatty) acid ligase
MIIYTSGTTGPPKGMLKKLKPFPLQNWFKLILFVIAVELTDWFVHKHNWVGGWMDGWVGG